MFAAFERHLSSNRKDVILMVFTGAMPLRLDVKRKLLARSDRVKCVDLHPTETWMLVSLYNGNVHIWNYENQQLVKSFEVRSLPFFSPIFRSQFLEVINCARK